MLLNVCSAVGTHAAAIKNVGWACTMAAVLLGMHGVLVTAFVFKAVDAMIRFEDMSLLYGCLF